MAIVVQNASPTAAVITGLALLESEAKVPNLADASDAGGADLLFDLVVKKDVGRTGSLRSFGVRSVHGKAGSGQHKRHLASR